MICPKCGFTQPEVSESCQRCGVIFAKLAAPRQMEAELATAESQVTFEVTEEGGLWGEFKAGLVHIAPEEVRLFMAGRAIVFLLMLIWGWGFLASSIASGLLINLCPYIVVEDVFFVS